MSATYDKNATPDPNCKACQQSWPIHVDQKTGERMHVDLFATTEYGCLEKCPTQNWPDEEMEETL